MKRVLTVVGIAMLLVTGLRAEILEQILVKVNGEILTKTELEKLQIAAIRDHSTSNPATMTDAELGKALAEVTPQVIVDAVDELLILQRAKTLGYAVTDEQFNNVLESIRKDNKIDSEQAFQAALKQEGLTLPELRRMLEKRMLISQVTQREVISHIDITEADQHAYYDAHTAEFASVPSVTLREIMVTVPTDPRGVNAGAVDDAQAKAEGIRARLLKGEVFEKVAAEVSDAPSKGNGGLIGPIPKTELADELAKAIGSLKPGEITPVLRVAGGFEILKLESVIESTTLPFDQARPKIMDKIGAGRQDEALHAYMKKLRTQALIEWKNDEIKKAWDAGVAEQEKDTKQGN
jgi:peptidyl-prolyl cis-trans isomerase SurA